MSLLTSSTPNSGISLSLWRSLRSGVAIAAMVARVRLGLSFGGLNAVRARLLPEALPATTDFWAARRVGKAVAFVSYFVPFASCLTQAQACQIILANRGIHAVLFLGVQGSGSRSLRSHAWLIVDGRLVTGAGPDLANFRVIATFGPSP
ncbi:MAG: lasso peptide biosynthesis B2 protein [Hyphomicrobiales bacterium]|nr:MAG: lasso peptide biosynthesis B2 protein [Hyphomicrobiales bacterium]